MKHILPTDTVNKVLNYLAGKAYAEVNVLIAEIQKVAVAYEEPAEKPPEPAAPVAAAPKGK